MDKRKKLLYCINFKLSILFCLFIIDRGVAQHHDQNWIMGEGKYILTPSPPDVGLMLFSFKDSLKIQYIQNTNNNCYMSFTNNCISDKEGNLVAYTDGHNIFNRDHHIMEGGDTINPGDFWPGYLGFGYPIEAGAIFVPIPDRLDEYILLHKPIRFGKVNGRLPEYLCDKVYATFIKYDTVNHIHKAYNKNTVLLEGEISESEFAIAKHGNGRDFWAVCRKIGEPLYYFFLIDPTGVYFHHEQRIGNAYFKEDLHGMISFNKLENIMARVIPIEGLEVMEFDRCKGLFYNPILLPFPDTFLTFASTIFSPNGKYLYVNSIFNIYQYEISKRFDPSYQPILVGKWDSVYIDDYSTLFYVGRLALNNKIYFTVFGTNGYHLHTMHKPDEYGLACDFRNHDLELPTYIDGSLPFFPNYRLGSLKSSSCDSLSGTTLEKEPVFYYSSLVRNSLYITCTHADKIVDLDVDIYSLDGRRVWSKEIRLFQRTKIELDNVLQGMYIVVLREDNVVRLSSKIVVTR